MENKVYLDSLKRSFAKCILKKAINASLILLISVLLFGCQAEKQPERLSYEAIPRSLFTDSQNRLDLIITNRNNPHSKFEYIEGKEYSLKPLINGVSLVNLTSNLPRKFRSTFEYYMGVDAKMSSLNNTTICYKSGCIYETNDGDQISNPTFLSAFFNTEFRNRLKHEHYSKLVATSVDHLYEDLNDKDEKVLAALNAYYNLLSDDATSLNFNPNRCVSREEFYALLYRSSHDTSLPIPCSIAFESYVGGSSELSMYAAQEWHNGYLQISDGSLDAANYKGAITVAEAIYTIASRYFSKELAVIQDNNSKADIAHSINGIIYALKNAGDVAKSQLFSDHQKRAYTLQHILNNTNQGLDQAFVHAYKVLIDKEIPLPTQKWYEPLTKCGSLELLVNVYLYLGEHYSTEKLNSTNTPPILELQQSTTPINSNKIFFISDTGHVLTASELITLINLHADYKEIDYEKVLVDPRTASFFNYDIHQLSDIAYSPHEVSMDITDITNKYIENYKSYGVTLYNYNIQKTIKVNSNTEGNTQGTSSLITLISAYCIMIGRLCYVKFQSSKHPRKDSSPEKFETNTDEMTKTRTNKQIADQRQESNETCKDNTESNLRDDSHTHLNMESKIKDKT